MNEYFFSKCKNKNYIPPPSGGGIPRISTNPKAPDSAVYSAENRTAFTTTPANSSKGADNGRDQCNRAVGDRLFFAHYVQVTCYRKYGPLNDLRHDQKLPHCCFSKPIEE